MKERIKEMCNKLNREQLSVHGATEELFNLFRELLIAYENDVRMRLFDDIGEDTEEYVDTYLSNL